MLKIGTVFSGIGAIEHALKRMEIPYEIEFACDTGDVDIFSRKMEGTYFDTKLAFDEMRKEISDFISENEDDTNFIVQLEYEVVKLWIQFSSLSKTATKSEIRKVKELLSMSFEKLHTQQVRQQLRHIQDYQEKKSFVDNLYKSKEKNNKVKQTYMANYPITDEQWHYNVCFMDGTQWRDKIDIFMGGSPCFVGNTYVLSNHKFYVREKTSLPEWKQVIDIKEDDYYVGICINPIEKLPNVSYGELTFDEDYFNFKNSDTWHTLGCYFGDFSLGTSCSFFKEFGIGYKKQIPSFMFDLPVKFLYSFLEGLFESESTDKLNNGYKIHISFSS